MLLFFMTNLYNLDGLCCCVLHKKYNLDGLCCYIMTNITYLVCAVLFFIMTSMTRMVCAVVL